MHLRRPNAWLTEFSIGADNDGTSRFTHSDFAASAEAGGMKHRDDRNAA
jgi:hypothetical protein